MSIISTKGLFFGYKKNSPDVLRDINLSFAQGTYTAILGHNGSGKSTLAKLLCGVLKPREGSVAVAGMDTADEEALPRIRETCGMVFQNPDNQLVTTIVEEDVAFAPENLGIESAQIRAIVDDALQTVDMLDYATHATNKLSGGQKQRIAIAGVLAMQPKCIIFDEATSMLDPTGRREITATMRRLNREKGITVITITHYMSEAAAADRIVVLNKGEVVMDGTPEQVFSRVEELEKISLSVPQVTELLYLLDKDGYPMPSGIIHTADAADAIEKSLIL